MITKFKSILFVTICFGGNLRAQNTAVSFLPFYQNEALTLDKWNRDSILIETFRCYISTIELWQGNRLVWKEENSYHLLDAGQTESLNLNLKTPSGLRFDRLTFNLGIDSLTSVAGILGADLDPTKGMYWAWQSGYINLKLEGSSPKCKTRKNEFQFHLGGYRFPYSALQTISLNISPDSKTEIIIDLEHLLSSLNLTAQNHIMSPCAAAVERSKQAAGMFRVKK